MPRTAAFGTRLCGTSLAKMLGVTDFSLASSSEVRLVLPRLLPVPAQTRTAGPSVGQAHSGNRSWDTARFRSCSQPQEITSGLDIADGPVQVVNQRLQMIGLAGTSCARVRTGTTL